MTKRSHAGPVDDLANVALVDPAKVGEAVNDPRWRDLLLGATQAEVHNEAAQPGKK